MASFSRRGIYWRAQIRAKGLLQQHQAALKTEQLVTQRF